jgi:fucose permease
MSEVGIVSIISMVGFLILAVSALGSHKLSMKKGVTMALAWAAIFAIVVLFVSLVQG